MRIYCLLFHPLSNQYLFISIDFTSNGDLESWHGTAESYCSIVGVAAGAKAVVRVVAVTGAGQEWY